MSSLLRREFNKQKRTRHEILIFLVDVVHDHVVAGDVNQLVVVLQVEVVFVLRVHAEEMPSTHGQRHVNHHRRSAITYLGVTLTPEFNMLFIFK